MKILKNSELTSVAGGDGMSQGSCVAATSFAGTALGAGAGFLAGGAVGANLGLRFGRAAGLYASIFIC
jgi:hypothetical protein